LPTGMKMISLRPRYVSTSVFVRLGRERVRMGGAP
jgi:hypothetical protein